MPFSFPTSGLTNGQQSTQNGRVYQWTGSAWELVPNAGTFDAAAITSGTLDVARIPSLPASQIGSGVLATARLGSGATATNFLRGDSTFAPAVTSVDGTTGAVTITKAQVFEFTRTSAPPSATGSAGVWAWSLPADAKIVEFLIVAAGGGGGSGRRGAAGTARWGGGGGAGGGVIHTTIAASLLTTPLTVIVGSGGAGGIARTVDDFSGAAGSPGGISSITANGFSNLLITFAGNGGGGGTDTSGSGGGSGGTANNRTWLGVAGTNSSVTGTPSRAFPTGNSPQGGAGGGGISTGNVAYSGGPQFAPAPFIYQAAQFGADVSGGAASTTGNATAGANGVSYGYGGCGGGASTNGFNSGAGGNGGDGYVRIVVWS